MANKKLHDAKVAKKDEFYTRLEDIGNELKHYRNFFLGKSVLCNCDDPYESNFFKFFALNFNAWGLKKLVATCYDGSPVAGNELELSFDDVGAATPSSPKSGNANQEDNTATRRRLSYKIEITEVPDMNGDGAVDMTDVDILIRSNKNVLTKLKGNGDFRSPECVEMLKEADVVVTNPPFSLFREYVAQLVEYEKKFLIIGHQNTVMCKEIFPLIIENKIWLGYGFKGGAAHFYSSYEDTATAGDHREGMIRVSGVNWFTNIDHKKRHEPIDLYKHYTPEEYPTYDNYDAINVDKTADIPIDYNGIMGVPVTFMDKFNPDQFEMIWQASGNTRACAPKEVLERLHYRKHPEDRGGCTILKGKRTYGRIFIKRKQQ